jgi:hypothetical protein
VNLVLYNFLKADGSSDNYIIVIDITGTAGIYQDLNLVVV